MIRRPARPTCPAPVRARTSAPLGRWPAARHPRARMLLARRQVGARHHPHWLEAGGRPAWARPARIGALSPAAPCHCKLFACVPVRWWRADGRAESANGLAPSQRSIDRARKRVNLVRTHLA